MMARGDWNHREVLGTYYTERGCLPVTRTIDVLVTICVQTMLRVPVLTVCVAKGHPIIEVSIEVYRYAHSAYEVHAFSKLERDDDGR